MNLQEFTAKYAGFKDAQQIEITCDHPEHEGGPVTIGKQPAKRNILKNGGDRFICRKCMMKHDNPMQRPRERRQTEEMITVVCTHPDHEGPREREIQKSAYFGSLNGPKEQICKRCVQLGKVISEEQKEAISKKLTGRELAPEHVEKIREYMLTNEEGIARGKKNLVAGYGGGWNKGQETPDEVKEKISKANSGKVRTKRQRQNISVGRKKMLEETGGFTDEHRENLSRAAIEQYKRGFNPKTHHLKGWHEHDKAGGKVFYSSSYELKAFMKLDDDNNIKSYRREQVVVRYFNPKKKFRASYLVDIEVKMTDGSTKWIEVKPAAWLSDEIIIAKHEAAEIEAESLGIKFEVWTELELFGAVANLKHITDWSEKVRAMGGVEMNEEERKARARARAKKHYRNKIAVDTVVVDCPFCEKQHVVLRKSFERNIARNGRYICEREGGSISGKKSKKGKP